MNSWIRFCRAVDVDPSGLNSAGVHITKAEATELLCSYVAHEILIRGNSPQTLDRSYIGHIDYHFQITYEDPFIAEARRSKLFQATLAGFTRVFHVISPLSASKKLAVGLPFIFGMRDPKILPSPVSEFDSIVRQAQLLALSIGVFFLLRKCEFLPGNYPSGCSRGLRWDHFTFFDSSGTAIPRKRLFKGAAQSVVYKLDCSKSDQNGKGRILAHYRQDSPMCIVAMAEDWSLLCSRLAFQQDHYVFEVNNVSLFTCTQLLALIKEAASAYGIPHTAITLHCLRYGGASMLATAGFPQYIIELCGGWAPGSQALRTYIQLGQETMSDVSKAMATAFRAGLHDMRIMSNYVGAQGLRGFA
jgi:hypothetical protein